MGKRRGRLPKCPDCGVDIVDKDKAKKISGRWVCEDCQEVRNRTEADRQELYALVADLFFIEFPTGGMMRQIKNMREENGYTYKGMTLSLEYWIDTLGNTMQNAKGVGIIPYIYEDAKQFYIEKMNVARQVDEMEGAFTSDKQVTISRSKMQPTKKHDSKMIDMNDL